MTELQAAVGLAQIKKMKFILAENKKRFEALNESIFERTYTRKIYPGSTPSYDTFLFKVKKNQKNKITKYLNNVGIGTKNLPDAIKWHFAFYWRHAISKKQLKNTYKSKKILENYIAVPILLKKSLTFYREISKNLANYL